MAKILGQEIGRHNLGHLDLGPRSCSRSFSRFFHWVDQVLGGSHDDVHVTHLGWPNLPPTVPVAGTRQRATR